MNRTVTTQAALDRALSDKVRDIYIDSPGGVWLTLSGADSSHVEARGSSHVEAWGSSHVEASKYVAIHLHSQRVTLTGDGVIIDLTSIDLADSKQWCDFHGVKVTRGALVLYKAVDSALRSSRGFTYPLGEKVADPNWSPGNFCGGGLHLSPSPASARAYFPDATRFLAVKVKITEMCPSPRAGAPKVKVQSGKVLHEVDANGAPLPNRAST